MLKVVMTCEHGGNQVPEKYQPLFYGQDGLLQSHRGYDIGALPLFTFLAEEVAHVSFYAEQSRLVVDLNRSLHSPELFSEKTNFLSPAEKEELLRELYFPYRSAVQSKIRQLVGEGNRVLHLSVHTFTPVLNGEERQTEVGLLFDPERPGEKHFCEKWRTFLQQEDPELEVRMNNPYLGTADGFTTSLRAVFRPEEYAGIELEVNQKFFLSRNKSRSKALALALRHSIRRLLSRAGR
ncbi:N-formylglutamate amidohydrolase [soil metagenome]